VFTSNLISQTTWLKVKLKLVNLYTTYRGEDYEAFEVNYQAQAQAGLGIGQCQTFPSSAEMQLNRLKSAAADEQLKCHCSAAPLADSVSAIQKMSSFIGIISEPAHAKTLLSSVPFRPSV